MLYTVIWRAKSGLILLNLSCYIQQEAEETFCILSLSTFEGLVFQKKLQLASKEIATRIEFLFYTIFYSNSQELSFHFVKILDNRN